MPWVTLNDGHRNWMSKLSETDNWICHAGGLIIDFWYLKGLNSLRHFLWQFVCVCVCVCVKRKRRRKGVKLELIDYRWAWSFFTADLTLSNFDFFSLFLCGPVFVRLLLFVVCCCRKTDTLASARLNSLQIASLPPIQRPLPPRPFLPFELLMMNSLAACLGR